MRKKAGGVKTPKQPRLVSKERAVLGEKPEWRYVLDLLKETDPGLHNRILRRLMNYMTTRGVHGVEELLTRLDPAIYAERDMDSIGANQPLPKRDPAFMERLSDEIKAVAATAFSPMDLSMLVKQWVRQDKLGFFALAVEKRDISLMEINSIVDRLCRDTREGETALSPGDEMNVRVALTRRFLTDDLSFIRSAKRQISVHDFGRILKRVAGPANGNGKLGGKASGLILAAHILRNMGGENPLLRRIKIPHTWYLTSDGLFDFVHYNSLEDLQSFKYATVEEVRHNYPYIEQVFKNSLLSPEMTNLVRLALEDLGEGPIIVRSSSLLEDSEGSAFSGKYRSLFLANTGSRKARLEALMDAIAEVYASIFGPDPIEYRKERGLLDFMEEMGIIIQKVVGQRAGKYFFPALAGVAFSRNEFRWSPRIRREDGVLRIVAGLGTRAVDRIGDDFPLLVCPGQPNLKVNVSPEQVVHYAQRYIDVLNLETGRFESPSIESVLKEVGDEFPALEKVVSVYENGSFRKPLRGLVDPGSQDLVVTFAGLLEDTDFVEQMRSVLSILQKHLGGPVDLEFAHDGEHLYILQCRPQSRAGDEGSVNIPSWIQDERKLFSANRYVTNGKVTGIRYVVYIDPDGYASLSSAGQMAAVVDVIGRLNSVLPRRSFILIGPGRWGSRGDPTLGVGVTYSHISNTQMLIEVARRKGNYIPDLSFGTHFFQDLVEARIKYLALYPGQAGAIFNEAFFTRSPNALAKVLPEHASLSKVVRVIDVEKVAPGCEVHVFMDGDKEQALGFLADKPVATTEAIEDGSWFARNYPAESQE